jgi:hypothetical protein
MRRAASREIRRAALAALAIVAMLAATVAPASAASMLEKNFWLEGPRYHAQLPHCETPAALDRIASTFAQKESQYWNSALKIVEFLGVRELAFRPWAVDTIPRRFCSGTVIVSSGKRHRVYYSIIEDGGLIGATWGVEWCVVGLDRNWAYNPACRMARP